MTRGTVGGIARILALAVATYTGVLITAFFLDRLNIRRHHVESAWFWLAAVLLLYAVVGRRREARREPHTVTSGDHAWVIFAAVGSAWLVYAPSLGLGLLSDDFVLLQKARNADFWRVGNEFFRPLPLMLWYALDKVSSGPWLLHLANITMHGVVGGLAGMLALTMGWGRFWSVFVALWVVVQPSSVEAVAWASGVQDVLMALCLLGALVLISSSAAFRPLGIAVLLVAALLSKETAVAAPALFALFWIGDDRPDRHRHWRYALVAASIVGAYVLVRLLVAPPPDDYARAPSGYFVKELLVRPFATLAVPWHDHLIKDHRAVGLGWALFPLVLLLGPVVRNRPHSLLRILRHTVWILIAVGPVYAYFFISPHLEGSRYLYLAMPAWVLLLTELLRSTLGARPSWAAATTAAVVVVLSAVAVVLNLRPWIAAAELRDTVLREARLASTSADCRSFTFEGVPDAVDGAYVFRNGFDVAVAPLRTSPNGRECRLRWETSRFSLNMR